jgi:(4S)-4-hydroxy-5-phosphonooxypentane-2,3-dione isomerase
MFVVAVLYEIKAESVAAFRAAILKNAAASLGDEQGCHRFDVSFAPDGLRCFLYELYADEAAFAAHRETAHFAEFNRAAQPMTVNKRIETFTLAEA